jgi:ATP-dependent exoDNAse (exonuclease V) alpha subunit
MSDTHVTIAGNLTADPELKFTSNGAAVANFRIAVTTRVRDGVATVDRLLLDLDRRREHVDARSVLVVDEAGMVGSRKLTRLLEHAHQARAKVVLVGDDRQLAAVDAGGGFRALRLRLGASELVENRRQLHAWERDAIELVRQGLVEEAVNAYREYGRVVAAESKPAMTLALLQDWWQAYREAECADPVDACRVDTG